MLCGWEGNRRSGVALAMQHRLHWFIHLRAHGLSKGDEHPADSACVQGLAKDPLCGTCSGQRLLNKSLSKTVEFTTDARAINTKLIDSPLKTVIFFCKSFPS